MSGAVRKASTLSALALALAVAGLFGPGTAAAATTFTVNTAVDDNDFNTADPFCDADPGAAEQCTLRAAIEQTNQQPGLDTIVLPERTYVLDSAAFGQLSVGDDVIVEGDGAATTVVTQSPSGRIFAVGSGGIELDLRGVTVRGGSLAAEGGAIINEGVLTLRRSVITGSEAVGSNGGGIWNDGVLTLEQTTVSGNRATFGAEGGGIFNTGTLSMVRSTVSGNVASAAGVPGSSFGAGIWNGGVLQADRSTISGNSIEGSGVAGGIYAPGTLTLDSVTIAGNAAPAGANIGRVFPGALMSARNSLIADPLGGGTNCYSDLAPAPTSLGHNLEDGSGCGLTGGVGDLVNADPRLGPLALNEGATATRALGDGSAAIDAGLSAAGETTDQRGLARPADLAAAPNAEGGNGSDIGAFELQPQPQPPPPLPSCAGKQATIVAAGRKTKGTAGNDVIVGRKGKDKISGKGGNDRLCGRGGNDTLKGGAGNDNLRGGPGKDVLNGSAGKDSCKGGSGRNKLKNCEAG